jgi:prephenate dehydrogenase
MARLLVIGTGLIGSSFAAAMRRAGSFDAFVGYDTDLATQQRAVELGFVDSAVDDPCVAAGSAAAVLVAVPPSVVAAMVARVAAAAPGVPVFDVGSVKGRVIEALRADGALPDHFVPCHPMAGTADSGPTAADAALFAGRRVIVTPEPETDAGAVARVSDWWRAAGAIVATTSCAVHDEMVALTSHLPHLLAYTFMDWLSAPHAAEAADFAGPGLRDFTRIAGSDPSLWREIFAANRSALMAELNGWSARAAHVAELLRAERFDELETLLARARSAQRALADGR